MISSFALVSGHPTPQSRHSTTLLAPVYGCKSHSEVASDEFCSVGCSNIPPNCPDDLCVCPEAAESALSVAGRPDLKPLHQGGFRPIALGDQEGPGPGLVGS